MGSINRDIPKSTAVSIIFGRGLTLVGWMLFSFLMIFAWVFAGKADTSFLHFTGNLNTAAGNVVEVFETNMEINEQTVWHNVYQYLDDEGNERYGNGYTTGYSFEINDEVTVEYPTAKPHLSRIPGVRTAEFSRWLLLMGLLPFIGVLMILFGIRRGLSDYKLLKSGVLSQAKLTDKKATNTEVNEQRVYKLTFEFSDSNGKTYQKVIKTHKTEDFEDDEFERIFYNPHNPKQSTLVDDLAGNPEINDDGSIDKLSKSLPIKPVLLPIICILPHIWYLSLILK